MKTILLTICILTFFIGCQSTTDTSTFSATTINRDMQALQTAIGGTIPSVLSARFTPHRSVIDLANGESWVIVEGKASKTETRRPPSQGFAGSLIRGGSLWEAMRRLSLSPTPDQIGIHPDPAMPGRILVQYSIGRESLTTDILGNRIEKIVG